VKTNGTAPTMIIFLANGEQMTTIAVSMKHREIAADSKCSDDGYHYEVTKLRKFDERARAAAGDWKDCLKFHNAVENGTDIDDDWDVDVIELRPDGIYVYDGGMPAKIKNDFYAIGSGSGYAIAAMHLGLSPAEAVALAAIYDPATGGEIEVWKLPDEKPKRQLFRRKKT
jgi:hypothetical protein